MTKTILELFSGTESFSKVGREREYKTFTVDFNTQFKPDLCIDIMNFDISLLPLEFQNPFIIWASPPCTTFSVASIGSHWKGGKNAYIPKSEKSKLGLLILKKTLDIIEQLKPKYYIIENPRGIMRKFIKTPYITTVSYCQYGDTRMKPTDLFLNFDFKGKCCKNKAKCHISAPRGSKTGTQGLKNSIERSKIPYPLCLEILNKIELLSK